MIRHIVMWKVRGATLDERRDAVRLVKSRFEGLRNRIPGLIRLEIGVDTSQVAHACEVVLYSEFESQQALADYATHPEHLRVRDELEGVRIARHQVDYEVDAS